MAIAMSYSCKCGLNTLRLEDAQRHADEQGHVIDIHGTITSRVPQISPEEIEMNARKKFVEAEILRRARAKGLIAQKGGGR